MTVSVLRGLTSPVAWRRVLLTGTGVPLGLAGAMALGLLIGPPAVLLLGEVQIETASGTVEPGSPAMVAVWVAVVLLGLGLSLAVLIVDRALVARLVPRTLAAGWPRLGWRQFFGGDAVWRRVLWFVLRSTLGVGTALWAWLVVAAVAELLVGSLPLGVGTLWRPPVAAALVLAGFHAANGVGWLLTRLAQDLLGPSPRDRIAELDERAALLAQRARLARELHDSVGHNVTVMVVQAAAARSVLDRDPGYAAEALAAIEHTGREAMGELGRVLDLLQAGDPDGSLPAPGLSGLEALLARTRAAGLPVRLAVEGDTSALPPRLDTLAYRIVQEGCTNVLRHAGAVPTTVTVQMDCDLVRVEVANGPGSPDGRRATPDGTGRGLAGLAERVEAAGGQLHAESPPGGGFRLRASIPLESA